jgi:hypothetical protein
VAAVGEKFQECFADFVARPTGASQGRPQWKRIIIADALGSRNAKRQRRAGGDFWAAKRRRAESENLAIRASRDRLFSVS